MPVVSSQQPPISPKRPCQNHSSLLQILKLVQHVQPHSLPTCTSSAHTHEPSDSFTSTFATTCPSQSQPTLAFTSFTAAHPPQQMLDPNVQLTTPRFPPPLISVYNQSSPCFQSLSPGNHSVNQIFSPAAEAIQQPSNPTQVGMSMCSPPQAGISVCSPPQVGMSLCSPPLVFRVKFIRGNISVCYGCRNRYPKKLAPPLDLCLQTEEWRQYTPAGALVPQVRWSNTYDCRLSCVKLMWPGFTPSHLVVDEFVVSCLGEVHKQHLFDQFDLILE